MEKKSPSIIFMGTPEFAVTTLCALHAAFRITAVVTVPDKPQGRGMKIHCSPIKQAALDLGISTIFQPESLKDSEFQENLAALEPDIIAVVAFRILPAAVYRMARLGAFNIHGSLLPKYRGAAPINWAIIRGETETGVTSFLLADSVDTGAIIDVKSVPILSGITAGELHDALMPLSAELAVETCKKLIEGNIIPKIQNDTEATSAQKIFKEMCEINWISPTHEVRNFIHGLSPYPAAWTRFDGKILKIFRAEFVENRNLQAGNYLIENFDLVVGCSDGSLMLTEIQAEGKRKMPAGEFLRGFRSENHGTFGA